MKMRERISSQNPVRRGSLAAMKILLGILCSPLIAITLLYGQQPRSGPWVMEASGTTAGLRGIHAVGGGVAWASGTNGTVLRTEDGGYMWQRCAMPPDAEKLDFRGIWAWDVDTAVIMSSGTGDLSRIYKTTDGCTHWKLLFTNPDKDGFWDAMVFRGSRSGPADQAEGWILGDPVWNEFRLWHTENGGRAWLLEHNRAPRAKPDIEGVFAASNSAITLGLKMSPAFGSGGRAGAFFNQPETMTICVDDCSEALPSARYDEWAKISVPVDSGTPTSGIFSLAFRNAKHGIAVGGDYTKPEDSAGTAAWTTDGGKHWTAATKPPHGFRSAVAWDATAQVWIAAGTNGSDVSYDDGKTWIPLDNGNWNALSLPWIVGPRGRIAKLDESKLPKN